MVEEIDPLAKEVEELIQGGGGPVVAEDIFLRCLTKTLVKETKFEMVHQDVLVVGGDQRGRPRPGHRYKLLRAQFLTQQLFQ